MSNAPKSHPEPLSPDHAFVVQIRPTVTPDPEHLSGRVEHIASGRAAFFDSLKDLYAFIGGQPAQVLTPESHGTA